MDFSALSEAMGGAGAIWLAVAGFAVAGFAVALVGIAVAGRERARRANLEAALEATGRRLTEADGRVAGERKAALLKEAEAATEVVRLAKPVTV